MAESVAKEANLQLIISKHIPITLITHYEYKTKEMEE